MKIKKHNKGFSLVELLVVIAIIAVLSVVAFTAVGGQTAKARNARRAQDLSTIQGALEIYFIENNNTYPTELDDGDTANPETDLVPKYMPKMALDPTTEAVYIYARAANGKSYDLAASIEDEDAPNLFTATVVGNNTGASLLTSGFRIDGGVGACTVTDGDTDCIPYEVVSP